MKRHLPLALIVGLLIAFRVLGNLLPGSLPNFQPLAALFFCGALLATGWKGFAIPFAIWAFTYALGGGPMHSPAIFLTTLTALTVTYLLGKSLANRSFPVLLVGSIAAAAIFHLITNTAAWVGDPMYQKSLVGFWQSVWSGPAGSPIPSWVFLRNLAAANVIFTAIFAGAQLRIPSTLVSRIRPTAEAMPAK